MLTSLTIRNYALVDELNARFSSGLMILTGETGAGKSIIIGALGILLGERASASSVRTGAAKAVIEGIFSVSDYGPVSRFLRTSDLDVTEDLILRREITTSGQNRCFINDTPVSLSLLREIGDLLVDIHGQHEHQSLLRTALHIEFLDSFAGSRPERTAYEGALADLRELRTEYETAVQKTAEIEQKKDLYTFQLQEIEEVDPEPGEDEQLTAEAKVLENAERIVTESQELSNLLYDGEASAYDTLSRAREKLDLLSGFDAKFSQAAAEAGSATVIVEELARMVREYTSMIDFSPERTEEVRNRLVALSRLKKKFGGSVERVIEHRDSIASLLRQTESLEETLAGFVQRINDARQVCGERAEALSTKRTGAIRKLQSDVVRMLKTLGIQHAGFVVRHSLTEVTGEQEEAGGSETVRKGNRTVRLTGTGIDDIEFLVTANMGEEPKPLAKIASGGELSRIMLALKSILAKQDRMPVVVFDEVDAGVSGRIAQAVGRSLKRLSERTQVIVITHLPQIAGLADEHFAVSKEEEGARTRTVLRKLDTEERVREVARLLSGERVTDAALTGAREMMKVM